MHGYELWRSDGTEAGTYMFKDISIGSLGNVPYYLTRLDDIILFNAGDGSNGYELWRTDGTDMGTYMVKDIWPGPDSGEPQYFVLLNQRIYFITYSPEEGEDYWEIWSTDGSTEGTVRDISLTVEYESIYPENLFVYKE
ncbi:MAG TPA: hypothetical protein PK957_04320 [Candidatus Dojkabacteria bacterium]|nr:hypothetical protein [Candidatus Dojkabacteria bacterium]